MEFTLVQDVDRYGRLDKIRPLEFTVEAATEDDAETIAFDLSSYWAGCDNYWVVKGSYEWILNWEGAE